MENKSNEFRLWYSELEPQIKSFENLYTIEEIVEKLIKSNNENITTDDIFELVFNFIFDNIIAKMFRNIETNFLSF